MTWICYNLASQFRSQTELLDEPCKLLDTTKTTDILFPTQWGDSQFKRCNTMVQIIRDQVVDLWNKVNWPNAKSQVIGPMSQPTENTGQSNVMPNHPIVSELHAVSGEWPVLNSTIDSTCHMHKIGWTIPQLKQHQLNPFSHFSPPSFYKRARTRKN